MYGLKGVAMAAWRVLRCNPWSHGGVDYVRTDVNTSEKTITEQSLNSMKAAA
jgi:putative component of membrane protein insertase Oxa1/YidC/SpoIIIJ protein YidD